MNEPPISWLVWAAGPTVDAVLCLIVTPVRNVAQLGPLFPAVWALAIFGLLSLGGWGAAQGDVLFKGGEDVAAFAGGRASWLGLGAKVIRTRKKVTAATSGLAVVIGWGGAALLYVVALVWWWCLPVVVVWLWARWYSTQRRPWER